MGQIGSATNLSGHGLKIAVVVSRFNEEITSKLLSGCLETLQRHGVSENDTHVTGVPGAFEIPYTAKRLLETRTYDAIVCLGAVIRGETPHFDLIAGESARALMDLNLLGMIPVINGIITTNDQAQAEARIGGVQGHKGSEAAKAALEMANLSKNLTAQPAAV